MTESNQFGAAEIVIVTGEAIASTLGIGVDEENAPSRTAETGGEIDRDGRLANTAFLVEHTDDHRSDFRKRRNAGCAIRCRDDSICCNAAKTFQQMEANAIALGRKPDSRNFRAP